MAINRAQGCWLGQLTGDALGSLVEFQSPVEIRRLYPEGVRYLADGGTWGTIAGQPFGYLWGSLSLGNGGGVGPAGCCPHPSPSGVSAGQCFYGTHHPAHLSSVMVLQERAIRRGVANQLELF